jgi:hypothetical protein
MARLWWTVLPCLLALASCTDEETPPEPLVTGVNDVKGACEIQSRWARRSSADCAACLAASVLPPCGCSYVDQFGARCHMLAEDRRSSPGCSEAVDACVAACNEECDCVDACYAEAPGCRAATAARDGCVAEVCAAYCE